VSLGGRKHGDRETSGPKGSRDWGEEDIEPGAEGSDEQAHRGQEAPGREAAPRRETAALAQADREPRRLQAEDAVGTNQSIAAKGAQAASCSGEAAEGPAEAGSKGPEARARESEEVARCDTGTDGDSRPSS
jgi:hypothetical protein